MPRTPIRWPAIAIAGLALISSESARGEDDATRVWQVARPAPVVPGAPSHADVTMRSLGRHPLNQSDPRDTLRAARELHVNRLEWAGNVDRSFARDAKALGLTIGASFGSDVPDARGSKEAGRVTGKDGKPKTHRWMPPGRWVGCANSPEYREAWLDRARKFVDAGVDLIQQDDPHMAVRCTSLCYCKTCEAAFESYKKERGASADYEQFQKDSVVAFHREMHRALDEYAGRHVPISHNNLIGFRGNLDWTTPAFDFVDAETDRKSVHPAQLYRMVAGARGMPLIFQFRETSVADNRRTLAAMYANGALMMMPWDIYLPDDAPRYFGKPEEYADLSGFIRANARYLDGYEDAATAGPGIVEARYKGGPPLAVEGGSGEAFAFARARPGESDAPAVIHLVEWAADARPFALRLRRAPFSGDRPLSLTLWVPSPYDPDLHRKAQDSGVFSAMTAEAPAETSTDGESTIVRVPALHPWGILVIRTAAR
jgi:hypothetical protein